MCLNYPWREVQERFLIKLLELNSLNEHSSYEFLIRKTGLTRALTHLLIKNDEENPKN